MSTVVCNKDCKYRKAVFCGRDFTMLNQFGMCDIWFDKNGQMRMVPNYPAEPESPVATEQELPQQEKSDGKITSEKKDENTEKTEDFLVREG